MQVFLETERLVLRRFTADDVDLLVELDSDPEVLRYVTGGPPTPREEIEGDILPEEPRRSSFPTAIGACGAALFIALFITGREAAVAALPDLAGLYAAIGLPVNLDGLAIEAVAAKRAAGIDEDRLTLTGTIRNVSGAEQAVPDLSASLYDIAGIPAGDRGFDPPARSIPPGEAASFHVEFTSVPTSAAEIVIRFRRAAEQAPGAVEAVATLP